MTTKETIRYRFITSKNHFCTFSKIYVHSTVRREFCIFNSGITTRPIRLKFLGRIKCFVKMIYKSKNQKNQNWQKEREKKKKKLAKKFIVSVYFIQIPWRLLSVFVFSLHFPAAMHSQSNALIAVTVMRERSWGSGGPKPHSLTSLYLHTKHSNKNFGPLRCATPGSAYLAKGRTAASPGRPDARASHRSELQNRKLELLRTLFKVFKLTLSRNQQLPPSPLIPLSFSFSRSLSISRNPDRFLSHINNDTRILIALLNWWVKTNWSIDWFDYLFNLYFL